MGFAACGMSSDTSRLLQEARDGRGMAGRVVQEVVCKHDGPNEERPGRRIGLC